MDYFSSLKKRKKKQLIKQKKVNKTNNQLIKQRIS